MAILFKIWVIKLYKLFFLHLLLSFFHLSQPICSFYPSHPPFLVSRALTYITLQQAPSKQCCLVSVLLWAQPTSPSSFTLSVSLSLTLSLFLFPPSSCIVATLHSLATFCHKAVNMPNETEIISVPELCQCVFCWFFSVLAVTERVCVS